MRRVIDPVRAAVGELARMTDVPDEDENRPVRGDGSTPPTADPSSVAGAAAGTAGGQTAGVGGTRGMGATGDVGFEVPSERRRGPDRRRQIDLTRREKGLPERRRFLAGDRRQQAPDALRAQPPAAVPTPDPPGEGGSVPAGDARALPAEGPDRAGDGAAGQGAAAQDAADEGAERQAVRGQSANAAANQAAAGSVTGEGSRAGATPTPSAAATDPLAEDSAARQTWVPLRTADATACWPYGATAEHSGGGIRFARSGAAWDWRSVALARRTYPGWDVRLLPDGALWVGPPPSR
ncbi:MAG: hypothetical protein M3Q27_15105 [Actinomycetota bacterium]|nr:hypothetical protein [Actinomycetota bacterium]